MTRVGIALLPEVNPADDDRWARIEQYGFAHAWCLDHLAWRDMAGSPWHATVPTLIGAALTTNRFSLGTFVASPNFRHPVPFAKELMTLDVASRGRLLIALGAGTTGNDATILGHDDLTPRQRMERFDEFVTLLGLMLSQRRTSWSGAWYAAVDAPTIPGPMQQPRPPFVVAGNGPRGMRLALRIGQGWVTTGTAPFGADTPEWWAGVTDAARRFDDVVAQRDTPPGFRRYLDVGAGPGAPSSVDKLIDDLGRIAELGYTDAVLPWPREEAPFRGSESVFADLAGRLDENAEPADR